jgi:hypothetical protein
MPALLLLDPAIRDWVLFPLTVISLLVEVLRGFLSQLMEPQKKVDMDDVKLKCVSLCRCGRVGLCAVRRDVHRRPHAVGK